MATEFEQLRLSITLIDDASVGIKAIRTELRGTTGSATDYQKMMRDNTKNSQIYGDMVGYVDGRLVLLGGAVGYLSSKFEGIGNVLANQGPTITAFAQQQQQSANLARVLGMSIGNLKSVRSQAERSGIAQEDADKIAGSMMELQAKLSRIGGRTEFQEMLTRSGFKSDPGAFRDYTMALSKAKDYGELFKTVQQARKELEKYAIETEGMDPELAREMGIKWMLLHGLPAQAVALEALSMPTKEYLAKQQERADAAERWLKEVVQLNQNITSIKGKITAAALSPESPFYEALQKVVNVTKWMADNAEKWFAFWFLIQNPNLLIPFLMPGAPGGRDDKAKPTWPPSMNPLEWHWNPFKWRWRMQLSQEVDDLTDQIQKINLITSPTGPKIVPAAFEGGGGGTGYSGTQGLPGWLQTPGGGGRLPPTPGTGTGSTPGTGTGGTPGTPSGPAAAPQVPGGGAPRAAPSTPATGVPPTGGATPTPRTSTPGTGTGSTPGTNTGGTPNTPSAATPSPGTPQAGELPIIDYSAQANLRTGGDMSKVEGMVIHHTSGVYGGRGPAGVADVLRNRGFSSTFFIDREGKIYRLTPEGKMAFHTKPGGTGTMGAAGAQFSNRNMEGVEIEARNDADVLPIQRAAAANLIGQRSRLHGYDPKTNVVGHGELNRDKERDEGMSTVRRIRSGELSTAIGTAMPAAEPRAPEEATPVAPHPLLGAQQTAPVAGKPVGVDQPAISEFGLPAVPKEYVPKILGGSAAPAQQPPAPEARQGGFSPIPPSGLPKMPTTKVLPADEEGIVLPPTPPPLPPLPPRPDRPGWTDRSGRRHYYPPGWLARKEYDGRRELSPEEVGAIKGGGGNGASKGDAADAPDRSVIDRASGNELRAKVGGEAKASVDVSTPSKSGDAPEGLFKKDTVERQTTMEPAETGPSVEVD